MYMYYHGPAVFFWEEMEAMLQLVFALTSSLHHKHTKLLVCFFRSDSRNLSTPESDWTELARGVARLLRCSGGER